MPMEPMSDAVKKRARARRGKSAPPVRDRGRFVPPLATDFEISLKVARTMAPGRRDFSREDSLTLTRMLLQKDITSSWGLTSLQRKLCSAMILKTSLGRKERMAQFMSSQRLFSARCVTSLSAAIASHECFLYIKYWYFFIYQSMCTVAQPKYETVLHSKDI